MTTYYVGPGGNDGNDGLSWANRFLTLNGAEDEPVASGDIVYVAPGIYRETLTVDVDGASEIQYIADVTGENTDGIGGKVIISGSDGDTTGTRAYGISATSMDYRTFIGFHLVGITASHMNVITCNNWKVIDCVFDSGDGTGVFGIEFDDSYTNIEVTRCLFYGTDYGVYVNSDADQAASGFTISDCVMLGNRYGVRVQNVDSVVIQNCTVIGCASRSIDIESLATSQSVTVRNCIIQGYIGFDASVSGEVASTYCHLNVDVNTNWTAGTGDVEDYVVNWDMPLLVGHRKSIIMPIPFVATLSQYSYSARRTGASKTTTDLFGITKPTTNSKSSLGAIQYQGKERETTTTRGSSTASIKFDDAGEFQIWVPVSAVSTTISIYVYREANYAGTLPRMVIKQPGVADRTTTDTGSVSTWNQLTDTFTPSANTDYVVVCLQSLNTATSGSYAIFFDDLAVT
ncbi:MAG: right-handed parallel beta-helix repeat-containing protein [Candidatus Kariarchaeaceae archaeon]|jgi:hypothetical protein